MICDLMVKSDISKGSRALTGMLSCGRYRIVAEGVEMERRSRCPERKARHAAATGPEAAIDEDFSTSAIPSAAGQKLAELFALFTGAFPSM